MPTVLAQAVTRVGVSPSATQPFATLSFAAYSAGADELLPVFCLQTQRVVEPSCVLELTQNLHFFLEREFSLGLLQRALVTLQPPVQLYGVLATRQEPARTDWPFLLDDDVSAVATWCERQQYPLRANPLQDLLETMLGQA